MYPDSIGNLRFSTSAAIIFKYAESAGRESRESFEHVAGAISHHYRIVGRRMKGHGRMREPSTGDPSSCHQTI